jgi:hypothetical protein
MALVSARLVTAFAADPALRGSELDEIIRIVPGKRAVMRGRLNGRAVVFRLFLAQADTSVDREWAELTRIWPHMRDGDLRIAAPLHLSRAHGLMVIEDVPGTPLMEHLYSLPPQARGGILRAPAAWLRRYTAPTEQWKPGRAAQWLARAEAAAARQPHALLQQQETRIISELRRITHVASAQDWRFAICHGDFHPNNLILNTPRLTGIDLGGSASLPIYKDMARFLMHMGRRDLRPSGEARFGVDREGFDAFAQAFALSDWERDIVLPFMLGVEALIRVEGPKMSGSRIRRAARMYDLLIPELSRISGP